MFSPSTHMSATRPSHRQLHSPRGFTLVELLVVIAVITVLIAILLPAMRSARSSASGTRELAFARQLMTGYLSYATDHRGALMPGFYDRTPPLRALDEQGTQLPAQETHRYPWRLAPYLDFNLEALYHDPALLEQLRGTDQFRYFASLYPSMGLNTVFVGGDSRSEGLGFSPQYAQLFGAFYSTRLSQVRRPADLIVFGSARTNSQWSTSAPPVIEGFFRIESPYLLNRRWAEAWAQELPAKDFGYLSLRHSRPGAAIGFLDGHTGVLDETQLQDMRHWADAADRPDWILAPQ